MAPGGGILGFLNQNPVLAGSLIQGIGSGASAGATAKDERRTREEYRANYDNFGGAAGTATIEGTPGISASRLIYDPLTGRTSVRTGV